MKPLVINLCGGPGCGKSTITAGLFAWLKWEEVNCEMALEYAKECVWFKMENLLKNQTYVFGQQHNKIFHLSDQVDVVITDSPLLLSIIYDKDNDRNLRTKVLQEYRKYNNVNYLLKRKKKYNPIGRMQTEDEAKVLDTEMKNLLDDYGFPYKELSGSPENIETIGRDILTLLKVDKNDLIPPSIPLIVASK
jgi:hypothetical protein